MVWYNLFFDIFRLMYLHIYIYTWSVCVYIYICLSAFACFWLFVSPSTTSLLCLSWKPWIALRMVPVAEWMGLESSQLTSVFPNIGSFNSSVLLSRSALFQWAAVCNAGSLELISDPYFFYSCGLEVHSLLLKTWECIQICIYIYVLYTHNMSSFVCTWMYLVAQPLYL